MSFVSIDNFTRGIFRDYCDIEMKEEVPVVIEEEEEKPKKKRKRDSVELADQNRDVEMKDAPIVIVLEEEEEEEEAEDIWAIFKKSIEDGEDINGCIDTLKNGLETSERKKKRTSLAKAKPKRKPSAYNNFVSITLEKLKQSGSKENAKKRLARVVNLWKELSDEEKAKYNVVDAVIYLD